MKIVQVTPIWYGIGGIQHSSPSYPVKWNKLKREGYNTEIIDDVNSLNAVVINTQTRKIVQASGFSPERGMYCDLF